MDVLVWLLVIAFVGGAGFRWKWVRDLPDPAPFRTEDDPAWLRYRYLGAVD